MSLQGVALRLVLLVGVLQGLVTVVRSECDDGVCVPLTQCKNYHINELISIRLQDSECEHYLNVCCDPENVEQPVKVEDDNNNPKVEENGPRVNEEEGDVSSPKPDDDIQQTPDPEIVVVVSSKPVDANQEKHGDEDDAGVTPKSEHEDRPRFGAEFGECGIRNKDGVIFSVTDAQHQEAQFGEFPWMVAILQYDADTSDHKYSCGGSLIAPNAVLTAAHCVLNKDADSMIVRAGEWDTMTTNEVLPHQERKVAQVITHEHFNEKAMANDVAVLLLAEPFTAAENVQLACLPPQGMTFDNVDCFAAGWGKANFHTQSYQAILKKLELPMIAKADCQAALQGTRLGPKFRLHPSFVCAGGQQGVDTCTGDGGSPLVCPVVGRDDKYYQAGIVAWGIECGQENVPGVYVKASLYTDWINEKLAQANQGGVGDEFQF